MSDHWWVETSTIRRIKSTVPRLCVMYTSCSDSGYKPCLYDFPPTAVGGIRVVRRRGAVHAGAEQGRQAVRVRIARAFNPPGVQLV